MTLICLHYASNTVTDRIRHNHKQLRPTRSMDDTLKSFPAVSFLGIIYEYVFTRTRMRRQIRRWNYFFQIKRFFTFQQRV